MNHFVKWLLISLAVGLGGLIAVFYVEDAASVAGELNRGILLAGILAIFGSSVMSVGILVKANARKDKRELIVSGFCAVVPLLAIAANGLLFAIYFTGK